MNFIFEKVISGVVMISVISLFIAIFINFTMDDKNIHVKKGRKSIVATGTMVAYYIFYYIVLRLELGAINVGSGTMYTAILTIGAIMVAIGAVINILGRLTLKNNWANHIKIYENHTLVMEGVYKIVRHPLYASIMLMLFGGSLVYRNWLSVLLTAFVFIPFMHYRAKQEEDLLQKEFAEYKDYKNNVGMFFPKFGGNSNV